MAEVLSAPPSFPVPVGRDSGIFDILRTMRSIRRLRSDPVPDEIIAQVVEAATWAPSAKNQQATEFIVITDPDQKARLAPLWREALEVYAIATQKREALASDKVAQSLAALAEGLERVPVIIAICHPVTPAYPRPDPVALKALLGRLGLRRLLHLLRSLPLIMTLNDAGSAYPTSQNLLLAARALGLGASVFTLHMLIDDQVDAVLGVPDGVRVMELVAMGWPLGHFGPVRRRPVSEVMHANRW